jgi:two-component system phosphate regulon sensor histidine kinase PhoR
MWRSRIFWQLLGTFGALWLTSIGFLGAVIVNLPLAEGQDLSGFQRLLWIAAAITGVAAMILALGLARRITRPIQELTQGTQEIAAGGFGHRVYVHTEDEVGRLAASFNNMSGRLATLFSQLDQDRQQLRAILSGMVEGVVALDAEQRVLFANERAAHLLEAQTQDMVGRKLWEVFRQRALQELVQKALTGPEPCQEELTWQGPVPRSFMVHAAHVSGAPLRGAVLVFHDTSELRRLERVRQEFVANVSHELKTPLAVIKACVETLLDGALDDTQHRKMFLEQVMEQADHLNALILDLLSLARIESGGEAFEFQEVALERAAAACLERHRARAEAKGQTLEATPKNGVKRPALAWADDEAVSQILDNLVDNAVKYTPAGGRIQLRWWTDDDQVGIEVQDSGIGIAERDLARIFERFYRVDRARSRELGGTGLGLSIVKHLVQAMRGTVGAVSQPGQGTTFTVRLPRVPNF